MKVLRVDFPSLGSYVVEPGHWPSRLALESTLVSLSPYLKVVRSQWQAQLKHLLLELYSSDPSFFVTDSFLNWVKADPHNIIILLWYIMLLMYNI